MTSSFFAWLSGNNTRGLRQPIVSGLSVTSGNTTGGNSITIYGAHLYGAKTVKFGTNSATIVSNTSTTIVVTVPAGSPSLVHVIVTTSWGASSPTVSDQYYYTSVPTISSIDPTVGPASGGTTIAIYGNNFVLGSTTVHFGTTAGINTAATSGANMVTTIPALSAGTYDITVTTPAGTSPIVAGDVITILNVPTVSAINVNSGPINGGTVVVISGTNFVAGSTVKFGTTSGTSVTFNSSTSITATSPSSTAGIFDITVTTPGGTSATSSADQFTYIGTPAVTSINPTSGPLAGGTPITITGTGFTSNSTVKFGTTSGTSVTFNSSTSITATSPSGTGSSNVTVTTPGGTSATLGADLFSYMGIPTVSSVTPNVGPTAGSILVGITGTNFIVGSIVKFGTTLASSVVYNSATSLMVGVPAGSAGTTDITVTTPGGISSTSSADQFTYQLLPTVSGINPTAGPLAGSSSVSITGTNFVSGAVVKFGSTVASGVTINSPTSITAASPLGSGVVDVTVSTGGGISSTSTADRFTYTLIPVVSSVTPQGGPASSNTTVTILGANFINGSTVKFGTTLGTNTTINSPTSITTTSPTGSGAVDVTVINSGGTSATSSADQYTYLAVPTITGATPNFGSTAGGTSVTVNGTSFFSGSTVTFGGLAAQAVTTNSPTSITAISPTGTIGTSDIIVHTLGGTSSATSTDHFSYQAVPTVSGVSPIAGPAAGSTTVTITGTNFIAGATVSFGGTLGTSVTVNSLTSITVTTPAGTGTKDITVTTSAGTSAVSSADQFTYMAVPTISAISATSGPTTGGVSVVITGTGFALGSTVKFGTVSSVIVTVSSGTSITAVAPAGSGVVDITVITPGGTSTTSSVDQFTYLSTPTVTSISPVRGPLAGGTTVTVTGTNFTTASRVAFSGVSATSVTYNSGTSLTVVAPVKATTGVTDIVVTTASGASATSSGDQFTYLGVPTVTSISPNTGIVAGSTTVTITGTNFASGATVNFGSTAGTSVTVVSPTTITVTSPAGTAGIANVLVTVVGVTSAISSADQFTYQTTTIPVISSMTPAGSMASGVGIDVVITGLNFTGTTTVMFGATSAAFTVNSNTQITAVSPSLTIQVVNVIITNTSGSSVTSSVTQFTYVNGNLSANSAFGSWAPTLATNVGVYDVANKKTAYNNIIESGASNLVINNINNNPTYYSVIDFYGNAVASGAIPAAPSITGPVDQVTAVAPFSASYTSFSSLPSVSAIDNKVGTFTVRNPNPANYTGGVAGQNSWVIYLASTPIQDGLVGWTLPITLSGFTPTGYNGTHDGLFVTPTTIVITNQTALGPVTTPGTCTVALSTAFSNQLSLTLTLSGSIPSIGDTLVITYAAGEGLRAGGMILPTSGQCGVSHWSKITEFTNGYGTGIIVGTVDQSTSSKSATITLAGNTNSGGLAATLSRWPNMAIGDVVEYGDRDSTTQNSGTFTSLLNHITNGDGEVVVGVIGATDVFTNPVGFTSFTGLPSNNISGTKAVNNSNTTSYAAGYFQQTLSGPTNPSSTIGWGHGVNGNALPLSYVSLVPAAGGSTLSIPAPNSSTGWTPGYYYVNLTIPGIGATGSIWGDQVDGVAVLVARPTVSNLPNAAALPPANIDKTYADPYMHGFNAMGPNRMSITFGSGAAISLGLIYDNGQGGLSDITGLLDQSNGTLAAKDKSEPSSFYFDPAYTDSVRKRHPLVNFSNDNPCFISVEPSSDGITSGVTGSYTYSYNNGAVSTVPIPWNASIFSTYYTGSTSSISAINASNTLPLADGINNWTTTSSSPTYGFVQDNAGSWHSITWTGKSNTGNYANTSGNLTPVTIAGSGTINQYATVVYSNLVAGLLSTPGFPANGLSFAWGLYQYGLNLSMTDAMTGVLTVNQGTIGGLSISIHSTYIIAAVPGINPSGTFTLSYTDAGGTSRTSAAIAYNATAANVLSAVQAMSGLSAATLNTFKGSPPYTGGLGQYDYISLKLPVGTASLTMDTSGLVNVNAYCQNKDKAYQSQMPAVGATLTTYNSGSGNDYTWFEGKNEPDQGGATYSNSGLIAYANQYAQLRAGLKTGNANAKVAGPSFSSSLPNGSAIGGTNPNSWLMPWIATVRNAGQDVDGISLHLYNGYNGQFAALEGNLSDVRTRLASFSSPSLANIPLWCTEAGNIRLSYGATDPQNSSVFIDHRRFLNWLTTLHLGGERYGMPKENICVYYDIIHGDPQFMPFASDRDLFPHHAFYRTYSDEIFGKTWYSSNVTGPTKAALTCGTIGNHIYRVDVFTGTVGTTVVLTAQGIPNDTITLNVPSETGTITYSDFQGNTATVPVTAGQITIPISDLPTYVRLAAASYNTITVADVGNGVKAATDLALGATASSGALSGSLTITHPESNAIDNNYRTDGYLSLGASNTSLGSPDYAYSATSGASAINAHFTINWAASQTINQVMIRQLPPHTDVGPASAMTSGILQYSSNGINWTNCTTVPGNHWDASGNYNNTTATSARSALGQPIMFPNTNNTVGTYVSYYDYNWIHHVHMSAPIPAKYLRLIVTGVTYGHFPDAASNALHNNQNAYLRISEFVVM